MQWGDMMRLLRCSDKLSLISYKKAFLIWLEGAVVLIQITLEKLKELSRDIHQDRFQNMIT